MYATREKTVESIFGIIKHALRFRQFLLRALAKVRAEWELVCLPYNVKRLYRLKRAWNRGGEPSLLSRRAGTTATIARTAART